MTGVEVVRDPLLPRNTAYLIGMPYEQWVRGRPLGDRSVEAWLAECVVRFEAKSDG